MKLSPPGSLACISCSHASRSWRSVNPSPSKNSGDTHNRDKKRTPRTRPRVEIAESCGLKNAGAEASKCRFVFSAGKQQH